MRLSEHHQASRPLTVKAVEKPEENLDAARRCTTAQCAGTRAATAWRFGPAIVNTPPPAMSNYAPPGQNATDAQRDALGKEAEAAASSSVFFRSSNQCAAVVVGQAAAATPASALDAFDPQAAGPASVAPQPADPTAVQNRQDRTEAFQTAGTTETRNSGNLQMPTSPYQVMAGTVIAAALVTGIKSDLPGDVIGTVTEPVYDNATSHDLLIPQGSRIFGKYDSQVT